MLNHAEDVQRYNDIEKQKIEERFIVCHPCGKTISQKRLEKTLKTGEPLCPKCGSMSYKCIKIPSLWREIKYLITHIKLINETIINPRNWKKWEKYFG